MKHWGYCIALILLCCTGKTAAQNLWTLEACLDSAVTNSATVRQLDLDMKMALINYRQSLLNFTPSLNGSVTQSYTAGRSLDPVSNEFTQTSRRNSDFGLSGNMNLFNGMARYYDMKNTELAKESGALNKAVGVRNVKLQVLTYYLQALIGYETRNLAVQHLQYTQGEEERIKKRIASETLAENDLVEIQSQRAQDELAVLRAGNEVRMALQQLKTIMQVDIQGPFMIDTVIQERVVDTTGASDVYKLPEMKQSAIKVEQSILATKAGRSAYYPSLTLGGYIGTLYSDNFFNLDSLGVPFVPDFPTQLNNNLSQRIYLSLNIPIFNGLKSRSNVQLRKIETEKAQLEMDNTRWELVRTLEQLKVDIENAQAELNSSDQLLQLAQSDFNNTELKFQKGLVNYSELLTKKDRLYNAQSNVIQSRYNLYFKTRILGLYFESY